jgi:hypothetical protein
LCEIQKLSSISRFEHEAQKKVASLPSLGLDSRSRFSDLSFHLQLCIRVPDCQNRNPTTNSQHLIERKQHNLQAVNEGPAEVGGPQISSANRKSANLRIYNFFIFADLPENSRPTFCNLQAGSRKKFADLQFVDKSKEICRLEICRLAYHRNLRICDCELSQRI